MSPVLSVYKTLPIKTLQDYMLIYVIFIFTLNHVDNVKISFFSQVVPSALLDSRPFAMKVGLIFLYRVIGWGASDSQYTLTHTGTTIL